MKRYLALAGVLVVIVGVIWFLESMKAMHGPLGPTVSITTASHSANYAANSILYPAAKEFVSPDGFINTSPTTLDELINKDHKVVLVDFWTYSCINCQRTIPYLEAWYEKYKNYGLVIVGVHSPEFEFEKVLANVQAGVQKFGITYPVVMDSAMGTWNAYENRYWPAEYLIDTDGLIRENSIGEGNYQETEQNIQKLLNERNQTLGLTTPIPTGIVDVSANNTEAGSPETYFGYERNEYLGNGKQQTQGSQTLVAPELSAAAPNTLYLGGAWNFQREFAENTGPAVGGVSATITYHYSAKNVYLVASSQKGVTLTIYVDGKRITAHKGADVDDKSQVHVQESRLYTLFQSEDVEQHVIQIYVSGPGLDAYTVTFG